MQWGELPGLFPSIQLAERWLPLLQRHAALVEAAEAHTRVTAVPAGEAVKRHYAESLECWRLAVETIGGAPESVVDVGSGGGFPGLVMACVAPETNFALVEPLQKRARLLEAWAVELGLANVAVFGERAEDAARGRMRGGAGLVTARAVASLPELLEYTAPFAMPGGRLALPKGSGWEQELGDAANAMAVLGCRFAGRREMRREVSDTVSVLFFEQGEASPGEYPRRAGMPHKRPL